MSIDLAECEREPICHLGLIQPHGYLLAVNSNAEITHASENIGQLFPMTAGDTLGRSLGKVLGSGAEWLLRQAAACPPKQLQHEVWEGDAGRYSLWIHTRAAKYIFEWEPLGAQNASQDADEQALLAGLAQIRSALNVYKGAKLTVELAAQLTGYDRVMVYQFHPDWSGEVIAEVRRSQAEPFLGLHYPASDIPPQARQLYTENLLRVLVDVYGTPVGILSLPGDSGALDLTLSQLRAMSPYHIEYLKNMKVGATTTASLICNGALWGLVAFQQDRRKTVSPPQKRAISEIAQTLSSSIETALSRTRQLSLQRLSAREKTLTAIVAGPGNALNAVLFGPVRLRSILHISGSAVWSAQSLLRMGDAPSPQELEVYASHLLQGEEDVVAIDSRAGLIAALGTPPRNSSLAGLIAIVVCRQPALILFGFRLEAIREVIWGGDINKPVLRNEQTGALSPRRSFAQYKQSISGKAAPWTAEDLATARITLRVLRGTASTPERMTQLIDLGFAGIRALATNDDSLHNSLLDAIGDGIFLVFSSGSGEATLRHANQSLLDLAEISSESGAPLPAIHDLLEAVGLDADLLRQCELAPQQVVIATRHGLRHFLVEKKLAFEISDRQGTVALSAILFTDTTRLERGREAFQAAEEKAQHLTFLKSSFLANMSHEIRTPMNGILGMVQLLQMTRLDPEQQQYLEVMQSSGHAMLKIINDILDLSKIEAGRVDFEKTPFDLTAIVEGVVDLLRPQTHGKPVTIAAVYDDLRPRWYQGDSLRLRQVLLNIAGNAVKFTSAGRVLIDVRGGASGPPSRPLTITVSDTGMGIPADQLSYVFDKFHQADPSTTRKHGGTGLGLAISRQLVELMGGAVGLASTVGVGSTFTISLPLKRTGDPAAVRATDDLRAAGSVHPGPPAGPGAGRRILVAEDDFTNQIVIKEMLGVQGFDVDIANSGLEVLQLLEQRRYDLILMDCHMPDLDGYETTERIRSKQGPVRRIPIVALTASALEGDRQRCLHAGMDDYISKPIHMETLWEVLRKWNCLTPQNPQVLTK